MVSSQLLSDHPDSGSSGYSPTELYEPVVDLFSDTRTPGHDDISADWHQVLYLGKPTSTENPKPPASNEFIITEITTINSNARRKSGQDTNVRQDQSSTSRIDEQQQHNKKPATSRLFNLDVISGVREEAYPNSLKSDSNESNTAIEQSSHSDHGVLDRIRHLFRS
ncbi:hypothetical protein BDF19DRAFT_442945 [Syncephalis fuscata]|nr:hypothetical protein BDF19DRAFT_442945 [Syncephalis fuscata]